MSNIKKTFSMYDDTNQETKKSNIADRVKEFFTKEETSYQEPVSKPENTPERDEIYSLTKKAASIIVPKDMDPVLKDAVEAGAAYLIFDLLKKYKT